MPFQFTAVREEIISEPAINCVWHLKGGVVKLSLEYLILVEVCMQNVLLMLFDISVKQTFLLTVFSST